MVTTAIIGSTDLLSSNVHCWINTAWSMGLVKSFDPSELMISPSSRLQEGFDAVSRSAFAETGSGAVPVYTCRLSPDDLTKPPPGTSFFLTNSSRVDQQPCDGLIDLRQGTIRLAVVNARRFNPPIILGPHWWFSRHMMKADVDCVNIIPVERLSQEDFRFDHRAPEVKYHRT